MLKVDVVDFGVPEVESEVDGRAGRVLKKLSLAVVRIALKE
jgi:hypothetical protein